ncbi:hypothetical protein C8Q72DRAFT_461779 [Fomitopsis betulina]|nr:hypothetical protein C8Q72DRAFT_461779 [Fomitopsis betulina]
MLRSASKGILHTRFLTLTYTAQFIWSYLVTSHGNIDGMSRFTNSFIAEFFLAALVVLIVQIYYICSIWRFMTRRWYRIPLTVTMALLALLSFCGGVGSVSAFVQNPTLGASLSRAEIPACIETVTAVVTDVYIAVALSITLRSKRTGFSGTDTLISKLVTFAIHRGIMTAVLQLLHFATYIGTFHDGPNKLIWALFHFPGSKIYTNSLLAVLNARHWLLDRPAEARIEEIELSEPMNSSSQGHSPRPHIRAARILVTQETCSDAGRVRSKSGVFV